MRLILARNDDAQQTDLDAKLSKLKVANVVFVVGPDAKGSAKDLEQLKPDKWLYFHLDEGRFSSACGLFKGEPPLYPYQRDFISGAQPAFRLFNYKLNSADLRGADERLLDLHAESLKLRGTKIAPSYLEITSVKLAEERSGKPIAFVKGTLYRAVDPRLQFLAKDEKTAFGQGSFDASEVKALPMGLYLYPKLSPFAESISAVAVQQKELQEKLSVALEMGEPMERILKLEAAIEETRTALKGHVGDLYAIEGDVYYYVGSDGQWRAEHLPGLRPIDDTDKKRLLKFAEKYQDDPENLRKLRENFAYQAFADRLEISEIEGAIPLTALMAPDLFKEKKALETRLLDRQAKLRNLTPAKGPLAPGDIPGLREGLEFFPHQSYLLGVLDETDRMLIDADPGAGKTLLIISDILRNMKKGKVKRPVVVMPEALLGQFASEVRSFSELNPWIISTTSVAKWKEGDLETFLEDAAKTPLNTVFLVSYNWLAKEHREIANGSLQENAAYKKTKIFTRPESLISTLKVDGVWMDECHSLKNASNQSWAVTTLGKLPVVRGLTGTIMPGNPMDILGPMGVIHSGVFGTEEEFLERHTLNGSPAAYQDEAPKEIRESLQSFGMRSLRKSAWAHILPKVTRSYAYVSLSPNQQKAYDAILKNVLDEIRNDPKLGKLLKKFEADMETGEELSMGPLLSRFTPLDVFLNAPTAAKDWVNAMLKGSDDAQSPKAKKIAEIAANHLTKADSGKVLVLVQYKEAAKNLIEGLPGHLKEVAAYYEGGKVDALSRFKDPKDMSVKILVAVDKTLRTGHNLQACNCIIHADIPWMYGDISQREGRAVRIGQKREVFIHTVLASGTSELLKMARVASAEHLIAKANSNFEDKVTLQPIAMTSQAMLDFRSPDQLKPYLDRQKVIEDKVEIMAQEEEKFFGKKPLKPRSYESISTVFADSKQLSVVPGAANFSGRLRDREELIDKELTTLPSEGRIQNPLVFHLKNWDESWHLVTFKSIDPQGFLRRYGFSLMRTNYYLQTRNKNAAIDVIRRIQKDFEILNIDDLERAFGKIRVTDVGVPYGVTKQSRKDKKKVSAAIRTLAAVKGEVTIEYATLDGAPLLFVDTLQETDAEVKILQTYGFIPEPSSWQKEVTRGQLVNLLRKIRDQHPKVKVQGWAEFKEKAKIAFKGLDLSEFDDMGL